MRSCMQTGGDCGALCSKMRAVLHLACCFRQARLASLDALQLLILHSTSTCLACSSDCAAARLVTSRHVSSRLMGHTVQACCPADAMWGSLPSPQLPLPLRGILQQQPQDQACRSEQHAGGRLRSPLNPGPAADAQGEGAGADRSKRQRLVGGFTGSPSISPGSGSSPRRQQEAQPQVSRPAVLLGHAVRHDSGLPTEARPVAQAVHQERQYAPPPGDSPLHAHFRQQQQARPAMLRGEQPDHESDQASSEDDAEASSQEGQQQQHGGLAAQAHMLHAGGLPQTQSRAARLPMLKHVYSFQGTPGHPVGRVPMLHRMAPIVMQHCHMRCHLSVRQDSPAGAPCHSFPLGLLLLLPPPPPVAVAVSGTCS